MKIKKYLKIILPSILLKGYHFSLALIGAILFRFPSRKIIVIGVTGTNGKSTTVRLISEILEKTGFKTAYSSSIDFKIGSRRWKNMLKMTMPGRFALQKFLYEAVKDKCDYAIIEVTSEGIKLFRHKFIDFDIAVFTNLRPEHIESHGNYENYKKTKGRLFRVTKEIHVINLDENDSNYFLSFPAKEKWGYTIEGATKISGLSGRNEINIIKAIDIQQNDEGVAFRIENTKFNLKLKGIFNVYNALAAIAVGLSQKINIENIREVLSGVSVPPGRLEEVIFQPFRVFVDYAHTPDALENVYQTLKTYLSEKNELICVLGSCGGGRDKWKRPILGKIAEKYCSRIILTNEDPYDEDPLKIISDIKKGITYHKNVEEIIDREKAIAQALRKAKAGDIVIITGKGSEPWMCLKDGKRIPWDDREIVKKLLKTLYDKI